MVEDIITMIANPIVSAIIAGLVVGLFEAWLLEEKYKRELRGQAKEFKRELQAERKKFADFQNQVTWWTPHDYYVLLDGPQGAGKSALVSKWMDPTTDISKLVRTQGLAEHGPVHVCSRFYQDEMGRKREDRYRLIIYDVGGEHSHLFAAIIAKNKISICILVIDPDHENESFDRFNPHVLKRTYLSDNVHKTCAGILIYVSKSDKHLKPKIGEICSRIDKDILPHLKDHYPNNLKVIVGSAQTGENLHDALGLVAKWLRIEQYFEKHKSLSKEKR